MKTLKYIGIGLLTLVLIGVILMFVAPTDFKVERSISIEAPKELVKEQIIYFKNANVWSPWADLDTNMTERIEGQDGTVGAKHFWSGNDEVGEGNQEIVAIENDRVETVVNFVRPFESKANGYFVLEEMEAGKAVNITWGFSSTMPRPFNIFGIFTDITEEIGNDYDKGLGRLKTISEEKAKNQVPKWNIEASDFTQKSYLAFRKVVSFSDMKQFFSSHYGAIYGYLSKEEDMTIAGTSCAIYYDWDEENAKADVAAAVPFTTENDSKTLKNLEGYEFVSLAGKAYKLAYYGNYEQLGDAHKAMSEYLEKNSLPMANIVLEEYITNPNEEKDTTKWLTNIYYIANSQEL